jgi:hypothetical protein
MVIYITIASICIALSLLLERFHRTKTKIFLLFCIFLLLYIWSATRINIGTDYIGEKNNFSAINGGWAGNLFKNEILYYLLVVALGKVSDGFRIYIAIMSFLALFPLFVLIAKNIDYGVTYAVALITCNYYLISFSLVRQFAGISISLLGTYYYLCGRKKTGLLFLILPIFIHNSILFYTIAFLIVCWAQRRMTDIRKSAYYLIYAVVLIAMSPLIFRLIVLVGNNIPYVRYYLSAVMLTKTEIGSGLGIITRFLSYLLLFWIINYSEYISDYRRVTNTLLLLLCIVDALSVQYNAFLRARYVFYYPVMFYFPIYSRINRTENIHCVSLGNIFVIAMTVLNIVQLPSTASMWGNLPYQSWLLP